MGIIKKIFGSPQVGYCRGINGANLAYNRKYLGHTKTKDQCVHKCSSEYVNSSNKNSISGCQYDNGHGGGCYLYNQSKHFVSIASGDSGGTCWIIKNKSPPTSPPTAKPTSPPTAKHTSPPTAKPT